MTESYFKNILSVILAGSFLFTMGCSKDDREENSPHTGNEKFEQEIAPEISQPHTATDISDIEVSKPLPNLFSQGSFRTVPNLDDKVYYVYTSRLNVRSAPEIVEGNILGQLGLNDEVKVIAHVANTVFVQIEILKTNASIVDASAYYVSKEHLSDKKEMDEEKQSREKYFIVQNVASERLRVYERQCETGTCAHKMIIETRIAVGEKSKDKQTMTVLGHLAISKWQKFYQDSGALYPSWYDPSYPAMPKAGSDVFAWRSKKVMPNGKGDARGAFGWYTALVAPNSYSQWTHGTVGWGSDKDKFIKGTRGFWANLLSDPRSHGCTRTDNESIAFIRHLISEGTDVLKVYAKEANGDPSLSRYPSKEAAWAYILTKNGVRVDGEKPDRAEVLARGTPADQWLEEGTYTIDAMPSAQKFKGGSSGAKRGKSANIYGLDENQMHGVFLVDEGRFIDYAHPNSLKVGGYKSGSLPGYVVATPGLTYSMGDNE